MSVVEKISTGAWSDAAASLSEMVMSCCSVIFLLLTHSNRLLMLGADSILTILQTARLPMLLVWVLIVAVCLER